MIRDHEIRRGTEQFVRSVPALDELIEPVAQAIRQHHPDTITPPILVIPPQRYPIPRMVWRISLPFGWRRTPGRAVVFGDEQVTIITDEGDHTFGATVIPLEALVRVRRVEVLLYGALELHWIAGDQVAHTRIEFHTVGGRRLEKSLTQARSRIAARAASPALPPNEGALAHLPLKFRNYMRMVLLPDEPVAAVVYEPVIRQPEGWFHPVIAPNRVVALAGHHLILMEDSPRPGYQPYQMSWSHIPRRRVRSVDFETLPEAVMMHALVGSDRASEEITVRLSGASASALRGALAGWLVEPARQA